jgi:prephenate dehydrogenase
MAKPVITIVGLGLTGSSMGLALQREEGNFEIAGHDKNPEAAQAARKLGVVQRAEWNLYKSMERAQLIVVAVPLDEQEELFKLIAEELQPGTLVFALGSLMQPALDAAARQLPGHTQFVAGHPVITGVGARPTPRADLFEQATFALAAGLHTDPNAVQLASDFVERVGATPLFMDAQEHDGISAGVEQLPLLLGAALMAVSARGAGWREARRLAGRPFAGATQIGEHAGPLWTALRANRANLLFRVKQIQQELDEWAALLEADAPEGEPHPLLARLEEAVAARTTWEGQALIKSWSDAPAAQPTAEGPSFLRQMFLGNLGKRPDPRR